MERLARRSQSGVSIAIYNSKLLSQSFCANHKVVTVVY